MNLYLKEPTIEDKKQILNMCQEIIEYDNNFEGISNYKDISNYEEWLQKLQQNKINIPSYSPQISYIALDENNKVIGGINIRTELVGHLINNGGNIGYLIRPQERNKGYGTLMLKLALEKCKELNLNKILITCSKENIASSKVIESNHGIYENSYHEEKDNRIYKRYWINI